MPVAAGRKSESLPQPDTTTRYVLKSLTFLGGHHYLTVREFPLVLYERWAYQKDLKRSRAGKFAQTVKVRRRALMLKIA